MGWVNLDKKEFRL